MVYLLPPHFVGSAFSVSLAQPMAAYANLTPKHAAVQVAPSTSKSSIFGFDAVIFCPTFITFIEMFTLPNLSASSCQHAASAVLVSSNGCRHCSIPCRILLAQGSQPRRFLPTLATSFKFSYDTRSDANCCSI